MLRVLQVALAAVAASAVDLLEPEYKEREEPSKMERFKTHFDVLIKDGDYYLTSDEYHIAGLVDEFLVL